MTFQTDASTLLMLLGALLILAELLVGSLRGTVTKTRSINPLTKALLVVVGVALLVSGGWAKLARVLAEREDTDRQLNGYHPRNLRVDILAADSTLACINFRPRTQPVNTR